MSERDKEELGRLRRVLIKDQKGQQRKEDQAEVVRQELEKIARLAVAKYHREVEMALPETQRIVGQVIQPWFLELASSGIYGDLLNWSRSHKNNIRLSDAITYYWPEDALKALTEVNSRPYLESAKFVVERYTGSALQRGIQTHADSDEVWYAGFELGHSRLERSEGVRIWRQPVVGAGFGFAMASNSYRIPIDIKSVAASLSLISPEVWIEFGQQIEGGKVWEVINQSMKPQKVKISTPEETQRHREADKKIAEEYLRNRQWY